jgi:hypothetical protein
MQRQPIRGPRLSARIRRAPHVACNSRQQVSVREPDAPTLGLEQVRAKRQLAAGCILVKKLHVRLDSEDGASAVVEDSTQQSFGSEWRELRPRVHVPALVRVFSRHAGSFPFIGVIARGSLFYWVRRALCRVTILRVATAFHGPDHTFSRWHVREFCGRARGWRSWRK